MNSPRLRIYSSDDLPGVELGGALKNVVAIAAGISDGLSLGRNARAALVTRGLAEISRLGAAMGGRAETFNGLAGLGDLVLTCTGDLSRNRDVGVRLARGQKLDAILAELGHVAEGVQSARAAQGRAQPRRGNADHGSRVRGAVRGPPGDRGQQQLLMRSRRMKKKTREKREVDRVGEDMQIEIEEPVQEHREHPQARRSLHEAKPARRAITQHRAPSHRIGDAEQRDDGDACAARSSRTSSA